MARSKWAKIFNEFQIIQLKSFPFLIVDLNLEELSLEAADMVMSYPCESSQLCDCVRKISKFICIQISLETNKDSDYESFDDESSTDSDWDK